MHRRVRCSSSSITTRCVWPVNVRYPFQAGGHQRCFVSNTLAARPLCNQKGTLKVRALPFHKVFFFFFFSITTRVVRACASFSHIPLPSLEVMRGVCVLAPQHGNLPEMAASLSSLKLHALLSLSPLSQLAKNYISLFLFFLISFLTHPFLPFLSLFFSTASKGGRVQGGAAVCRQQIHWRGCLRDGRRSS